jgi:hypothetical protein
MAVVSKPLQVIQSVSPIFDQGRDVIIFQSILTTFIESVGFRGGLCSGKTWLELKILAKNLHCQTKGFVESALVD